MTKDFYTTRETHKVPSAFGGLIYSYDFYGHMTMSDMAARIASDLNFDKVCKAQAENRNRLYKEKLSNTNV